MVTYKCLNYTNNNRAAAHKKCAEKLNGGDNVRHKIVVFYTHAHTITHRSHTGVAVTSPVEVDMARRMHRKKINGVDFVSWFHLGCAKGANVRQLHKILRS